MKTLIRNIALYIIGSLFLLTLSGCFLMYKKAPDLYQAKWKSISVEYLVREGKGFQMKTWSTTDQSVLKRLRTSLKVIGSGDLWGYSMSLSNKIQLELASGRKYILHIISETSICLNDYEHLKTGFSLDATSDFHDELKAVIESGTRTKIFFNEPRPDGYDDTVSMERALGIAQIICEENGWEWKDVNIQEDKDKWSIVTNSQALGMNAFIDIDRRTGEVLRKDYNPR